MKQRLAGFLVMIMLFFTRGRVSGNSALKNFLFLLHSFQTPIDKAVNFSVVFGRLLACAFNTSLFVVGFTKRWVELETDVSTFSKRTEREEISSDEEDILFEILSRYSSAIFFPLRRSF